MARGNFSTASMNFSWWTNGKKDAHADIFALVAHIHEQSAERRERNLRSLRLYGNSDLVGAAPYSFSRSSAPSLPENRVKVNVVSSMADTVTAKIAKMKPRVTFLTSGGNWAAQQNSQKLSKFVLGTFYRNDVYRLHQMGFKDCTVFDVGAVKHFRVEDRIVSERVLATELYVDDIDSMYGSPRSMYQVKFVHKSVLKKQYPKHQAAIEMAANSFEQMTMPTAEMKEYVVVVEAWHLPSTPDSDDGRHVICLSNHTILDEKYERQYFPFTFFKWSDRLVGYWGQSLAERLTGNQLEINKMLRTIQRAFHLGSAFKVFLEHGSRVAKEHINNEIGSLVYYSGTAPTFYVPQTVHSEYFRHLEFLIQSSYEEAGISQMSASSRKPAGIDSGKALREYNEVETERFALVSQQYEASFLQTAKQYVDLIKEMADEGIDYAVQAESKKFIETIKWSEIKVDDNDYVMQMFPVSMLPHTPAGRLQVVQELVNSNFIPKEFAMKLLDFPDVESYTAMATASLDDIMMVLGKIMVDGKYTPPEPYQDLSTGIKVFQSAYLRGRCEEVGEETLEMLRRWINNAEALLSSADAAQAQGAGPQPQQVPQEDPAAMAAQGQVPPAPQ